MHIPVYTMHKMYAHLITYRQAFTCMYSGVRATAVFVDILALDYKYLSHILTEPGKFTAFHLVFE